MDLLAAASNWPGTVIGVMRFFMLLSAGASKSSEMLDKSKVMGASSAAADAISTPDEPATLATPAIAAAPAFAKGGDFVSNDMESPNGSGRIMVAGTVGNDDEVAMESLKSKSRSRSMLMLAALALARAASGPNCEGDGSTDCGIVLAPKGSTWSSSAVKLVGTPPN